MKLELTLTRVDGRRRTKIVTEKLDASVCGCAEIIRAARVLASTYRETRKDGCRCRTQRVD